MPAKSFQTDTGAGVIADWESGDGPPLLMLHGGPGVSDYLGLLASETGGWRAIRYQQRCLAPSTLTGPFTVARHVADAVAVLDSLGIERTVVLGELSPMPLSQSEQTAELLPSAGILLVPAAGHPPWHEQPGCVAAALMAVRDAALA
jgi:pimeloyl-ACP methyl ester carboxylesterase